MSITKTKEPLGILKKKLPLRATECIIYFLYLRRDRISKTILKRLCDYDNYFWRKPIATVAMWAVKSERKCGTNENGSLQRVFQDGHPSNYEPRPTGLNFGVRTKTSAFRDG